MSVIARDTFNETWLNSLDQQLDSYDDFYRYKVEKNLPSIYRERQKVRGQKLYGDIHGARYRFKIPMKNGWLSDIKISTLLTTTSDNTSANRATGQLLYKEIILMTDKGALAFNNSAYMVARMDSLNYETKVKVENAVKENVAFNNNTVEVFTQPFFFFLENNKTTLDTDNCDQLYVEISVADSIADMGFPNALTNLVPTLIVEFHKLIETNQLKRNSNPKFYKQLNMLAYDIFPEPVQTVLTGTTQATLYVTCKYPVFMVHIQCLNASKDQKVIKSFSMYQDEKPIIDNYDRRSDFLLSTQEEAHETSTSAISYWFSVQKTRAFKTGALPLGDKHTYKIEVNFQNALDENSQLHCIWTYWYPLKISDKGIVTRLDCQ